MLTAKTLDHLKIFKVSRKVRLRLSKKKPFTDRTLKRVKSTQLFASVYVGSGTALLYKRFITKTNNNYLLNNSDAGKGIPQYKGVNYRMYQTMPYVF